MLKYKGYTAKVELDLEAEIMHGEVLDLNDVITFQGKSIDEVKQAFQDSVDDYLEFCQELGKTPEKPFSGTFVLRIDPGLHRKVSLAASNQGKSINQWLKELIDARLSSESYADRRHLLLESEFGSQVLGVETRGANATRSAANALKKVQSTYRAEFKRHGSSISMTPALLSNVSISDKGNFHVEEPIIK